MVNGPELTFNRKEWAAAYQNTESHPEGFWLRATEGRIPAELLGTYFRNGPGLFVHGQDHVAHPFDGHGLVASISFSNGEAYFRSQYVQTQAFQDETGEDRILYKGTFGTKVPGGLKNNLFQAFPRNPANTGVLPLGDRCLALFEAGQPYAMDPNTLATRGIDLLGGTVSPGAPFSTGWAWLDRFAGVLLALLRVAVDPGGGNRLGGDAVCAHPVTDPVSGNTMLFTFRLQLGLVAWTFWLFKFCLTLRLPGLVTKVAVREFDEDFVQQSVVHATLPGYCFLHDMGLTSTKYVAFRNPVRLHMLPLLLGLRCPIHCIRWRGGPTSIVLLNRPTSVAASPSASEAAGGPGGTRKDLLGKSPGEGLLGGRLRKRSNTVDSIEDLGTSSTAACKQGCGEGPEALEANSHAPSTAANKIYGQRKVDSAEGVKAKITMLHAEPAFVFHKANAYEEGSRLTVDAIQYPRMPDFEQACGSGNFLDCVDPQLQPSSQLWRYTMDTETGSVTERMLAARVMEFPAINSRFTGRRHRYVYAAAALHATQNLPQQAICKLDTHTLALQLWERGPHIYTGEPVFVPFPLADAEDDGWILSINYDASTHSSECVVLDARGLQLVTRLPLGHTLPHGLHSSWHHVSHAPNPRPSADTT